MKLAVTYRPSGTVAQVPSGTTQFNAAHWAGIPIASTCGGSGTCGKCKVRVLEDPAEPTPADHRKLLASELDEGWRLSCQLSVTEPVACEVPPLDGAPKAATMGVGRLVLLEPDVHRVVVAIDPPPSRTRRATFAGCSTRSRSRASSRATGRRSSRGWRPRCGTSPRC